MTIAFSTQFLDWTTKYSFEADEYGVVDNQMVGFPTGKSSIAWVHDKTESYNTFYGELYPSEFEVVTNEDPSAGKIYEAFSVESTVGDWSGEFITETGETQTGSFASGSLVEKEGKHYIDIPKNSLNKSIALKYVGNTTIGKLRDADGAFELGAYNSSIELLGRVSAVPSGYLAFALPGEPAADGAANIDAATALSYLTLIREKPFVYEPIWIGTNEFYEVEEFEPDTTFFDFSDDYQASPKYNPSTGSIDIRAFSFSAFDEKFGLSGSTAFDDFVVNIYTTSANTDLNGEDMRGEYMRVKISRQGSDYYELYCVNIDQHKTRLDHSLGQNN